MCIGFNSKKEIVAMLLAGGEGNRLHLLTRERAKPAVPFGGRYRIIDFTLSNCANSGINTVGVLTQYRPLELNSYIGSGQPWDLDRMDGGISILPPYTDQEGAKWYKGTANAIYRNINFVEQFSPDYVLILSGDHIYKMDYARMLDYHKAQHADATIAVLDVPIDEASSFGIMDLNDDQSVRAFEEKPPNPQSTKASMGVYIFNWQKLKAYLTADEQNPNSSNDFGKNIIPAMLARGERVMAYQFNGYWKDVGTINNLWEANMDLLNPNVPLNLGDPLWRIYSRHYATTPHYICNHAHVNNALITEGCRVGGNVNYSVLFSGVHLEAGANVEFSVVMKNTTIARDAAVRYAIISENVTIEPGAVIGCPPELYSDTESWGIAVIGQGAVIKSGQVVLPNEMVEAQ